MTKWTHVTIPVSDLDRSIEFYSKVCRLSIVRDRRNEDGDTVWMGASSLKSDQLPPFVLVLAPTEISFRLNHLGFQCDSQDEVDAILQQARADGSYIEGPTQSGGAVGYWGVIKDPDGHLVEFTFGQPLAGLG